MKGFPGRKLVKIIKGGDLKFLSKVFNNYITNQRGDEGNYKISSCKNILNGKKQALSLTVGTSKFSHQQIGIKEKDDKTRLDYRSR